MTYHATVAYLVRHAHARWVPDEMRPLSAEGTRAAEQAAVRWAAHLMAPPITHIISSDSLRAQQTVAPLARRLGLPLTLTPDLRERHLTSEMLPAGAFHDAVRATWDDPHFSHAGGECNAAAQARGVSVLETFRQHHENAHVVLSTHGNLLTLILQYYDPSIGFDFWTTLTMPDVIVLTIDAEGGVSHHRPRWCRTFG